MAKHITSNGDSGAVHSRQALQDRQRAARTQDQRNGSMTHGQQGRTVAEVRANPGR
jgi:hypothetical protein